MGMYNNDGRRALIGNVSGGIGCVSMDPMYYREKCKV